jgi:hypothetical protein
MDLKLTGSVKTINDIEEFASGFTKRVLVLTTNEKFPQDVPLEFFKERCSLLDNLSVGEVIKVFFNVRSNEYNGKYYVNLNGWKIEQSDKLEDLPDGPFQYKPTPVTLDPPSTDDLPF